MTVQPAALATGYRPEVDGLRAIAVLSVIFFHAGFGVFSGGFIGVDVFFVISGFLITGIILEHKTRGAFSFAGFYARRARRILPALAFVLVACIAPALLILQPSQQGDFFRTMVSVALFYSNMHQAATTGYFDAPAEDRPLLHTWSLSVEEQYYFFFPLLIVLCWRLGVRRLAWLLLVLALGSLALSEFGWRHYRNVNFFSTPSRAWELLAGSLAAFFAHRSSGFPTAALRHPGLALAGLAGILVPMFVFDQQTPTPSAWVLIPALGTVLVLLHGDRSNWVGRMLAARWLVFVGLISYSAYLWHQPVLVFARLASAEPLSGAVKIALIAVILCLAFLSWKFVEQPVRTMKHAPHYRVLATALTCSIALVLIGIAGEASSARANFPASVQDGFAQPERSKECLDIPYAHNKEQGWFCKINAAGTQPPSFFVFGDSHGLQLVSAFDTAAQSAGRTGQFAGFSGCAPLLGIYPLTRPDQATNDCHALNERVLAHVKASGFSDVYLVAKWSYYTDIWQGTNYLNAIGLSRSDKVSVEQSRKAFEKGFARTVEAYHAIGVRLHVIAQVPQLLSSPEAIYNQAWERRAGVAQRLRELSTPVARHQALQAYSRGVFRTYAKAPQVRIVNLDPLFCNNQLCRPGTPEASYYQDLSHLSRQGAALAIPMLTQSLSQPR